MLEERTLQNLLERNMTTAFSQCSLHTYLMQGREYSGNLATCETQHTCKKKECTSLFIKNIRWASRRINLSTVVQLHTSFGACKHILYFPILAQSWATLYSNLSDIYTDNRIVSRQPLILSKYLHLHWWSARSVLGLK